MAAMTTLRDILNGDPGDATDVEFNFNVIESYIASDVIKRDGTTAMTAPLTLQAGDPTDPAHAANKSYVDATIPVGVMWEYSMPTLTVAMATKWLICDGTTVNQADWPALFALIGTTFNTGGEVGAIFRLPDFRKRVAVGRDSAVAAFDTVGETGGAPDAVVIAHTHTINHGHGNSFGINGGGHEHTQQGTFGSTAPGDHTHGFSIGLLNGGGFDDSNISSGHGGVPSGTYSNSTGGGGNHSHNTTISGSTAGGGGHSHGVTGSVTDSTGVATAGQTPSSSATNANYPPFIIVTKIIRAA